MGVRDDERWRDQHPGLGAALETMTSAGTPLLAGFCVTLIGVVAQAPDKFWWASLTILLLTVAATGFVISIHSYYWARVPVSDAPAPGATAALVGRWAPVGQFPPAQATVASPA